MPDVGLARLIIPPPPPKMALQALQRALQRSCRQGSASASKIFSLANADAAEPAEFEIIGLTNELAIDADGWALIPYGDYRHSGRDGRKTEAEAAKAREAALANGSQPIRAVIQRFTKEDAHEIVDNFKSAWARIKRAIVGLPIYKGHPDAPRFANFYPDKTPRGTIADMEVTDRGLRLRPVLTEQGASDVKAGFNEFSPYWDVRKIGETSPDILIGAPFRLHSIGLVQKGNLTGVSLVNSAETLTQNSNINPMEKALLIKLLAALGFAVKETEPIEAIAAANDKAIALVGTQAELANKVTVLTTANAALEAEKLTLANAKTTLEAEKLSLANAKLAVEGELTSAKSAAAALRKSHATTLANAAFKEGRIAATERDELITGLCNAADFDAEAAKLAARQKTLKTQSQTADLGKGKGTGLARGDQVLGLVNARMSEKGEDYDTAWQAVQSDPKNASLFEAMGKPAVAAS